MCVQPLAALWHHHSSAPSILQEWMLSAAMHCGLAGFNVFYTILVLDYNKNALQFNSPLLNAPHEQPPPPSNEGAMPIALGQLDDSTVKSQGNP